MQEQLSGYSALRGTRILIVEDMDIIAMHVKQMVERCGGIVAGTAATVEQAMRTVEKESLDGAILDLRLAAGEEVYPVAELLQKRGVPFIFLSGYDKACIREDFQDCLHLQKPFSIEQLADAMSRAIVGQPYTGN